MKNENGIEKSAILKGQTLVNNLQEISLPNTYSDISNLDIELSFKINADEVWYVYINAQNVTSTRNFLGLVGDESWQSEIVYYKDGLNKLKITSTSNEATHLRIAVGGDNTINSVVLMKEDVDFVNQFWGMQSVEMPTLTTSNEDGTKTNILSTSEEVELRGIGEVQDTLDLVTGEVTERIGEIVLDGSENWVRRTTEDNKDGFEDTLCFYYRTTNMTEEYGLTPQVLCDRFNYVGSGYKRTGESVSSYKDVAYGNRDIFIRIKRERLETEDLDGFKKWLKTNILTVQYPIEKVIKTVDLTIQDQDNQPQERMKLFPNGHINTSSSTFPPILELKGIIHNNKLNMTTTNGTNNTQLTTLDNLVLDGIICRDGTVVRDSYDVEGGLYTKRVFRFTVDEEFIEKYRSNFALNDTTDIAFIMRIGVVANCGFPKITRTNKENANNIATTGKQNNSIALGYNNMYIQILKEEVSSYDVDGILEWIRHNGAIEVAYAMDEPQIIHIQPNMQPYVSTRPYQGSIESQGNILESSFLDYTSEQSIISPKPLGDGDVLRWEQGSQCYVYENDKEYIPLTDYNQPMGTVLDLEEEDGEQFVENLDGGDIIVDVPFKEKAVYERHLVSHEDNVIYPTQDKLDPTGKIEVDYICGETWQNPNDLSDIRHVGTLREDGQYDVTIRRSGDDEIRLMDGTTNLSLDGDGLNPSEFELTFFNSGGAEVGKYGDTSHTLEDCVLDSKLETGTVYGETLVNLANYKLTTSNELLCVQDFNLQKNNTAYTLFNFTDKTITFNTYTASSSWRGFEDVGANSKKLLTLNNFTIKEVIGKATNGWDKSTESEKFLNGYMILEGDYTNQDIPYFEGAGSTIVNGFTTVGKNLIGGTTKGKMEDNGLIVEWDNGIVTVNGCKTLDDSYLYFRDKRMDAYCITDGKYSISYKIISGEIDSSNCRLGNNICMLILTDGTNTHGLSIYENSIIGKSENRTFTRNLKDNMHNCWFRIHNGAKFNNFKIQFQLEKGNVATEFEECKLIQHTLPTPITLNKVGDVADTYDVVSGVETRKIDKTVLNASLNYTSFTVDDSTRMPNTPNHVFIELYSGQISHPINKEFQALTSSSLVDLYMADIWNKSDYANDNRISIGLSKTNDWKCQLLIPKIFIGDTITSNTVKQYLNDNPIEIWYERKTPQTIQHTLIPSTVETMQEPTFILPQPLRSVPNGICDRLYWDENKGHYCIEKRVERLTIDGSYSWSKEGENNTIIGFYGALNVYALGYGQTNGIILSDFAKFAFGGNSITGEEKLTNVGNGYLKIFIRKDRLTEPTQDGFKLYLRDNPIILYHALNSNTSEIIDLPHLNKKLTLPTQPDTLPIGYKVEHLKANPQLGLTIPYKQLNYPSRPQNIDFKMDIADYVLTWDDVKEARQYNVILNDRVIATVKEPQWNSGEEMYGYIMVEAQNELAENLSEELYIKTVPNAPAQLTVAHNPMTDYYDFEISFIKTSAIAEYYTVQYRIDGGEWVYKTIQSDEIDPNSKVLWRFSIYEINEQIEVWATATNEIGTNDILPIATYYMSPTPQWTYKVNSKELFVRWMDESPYDTQYKLRYQYKSDGIYRYAYFEGDKQEIGKLYEALIPLADDEEVSIALCVISEKENLYTKPIRASKELDPNIKPPKNFNYHWLARGLIEFYWEDNYDVDVEYEAIVEHRLTSGNNEWITDTRIFSATDTEGTGTVYRLSYQLEDLEEIRVKVRMKWAMNETEWSESLTTVFIPVEGNPPQWIRRTQTQEGLLVEWEAQEYVDSYHVYVMSNGEELQHLETTDNFILVDLDYSNSIDIEIYEATRFSGGIESDPTDKMCFRPTMDKHQLIHDVVTPDTLTYELEVDTIQRAIKERQQIHDINTTPNVKTKEPMDVAIKSPFTLSFHPLQLDVHQSGAKYYGDTELHIKTLDVKSRDSIEVLTFERITDQYGVDFTVYTPSASKYPITLEVNRVRIVCFGDSLTSGHPGFWA